jgi:hypothetical protein
MGVDVGDKIEISLKQAYGADDIVNVWSYDVSGTFTEIAGEEVAAAWWGDVRTVYRALVRPSTGFLFVSVTLRDVGDLLGVSAEYPIPSGEQQGTRTGTTATDFMPPFNAAGLRLTVGTRVTRPGQKRIAGLIEEDNEGGVLNSAYRALLVNLGNTMTAPLILAAPALGMTLQPQVFGKDVTGAVVRSQDVVGYVINPNITSQVSRKIGRGA